MEVEKEKSLDVFGIKPISKSIEQVTDGTINGAKAFLGRICLPAAEEFGLLLQDHVKSWRAKNAARIAEKAEQKVLKNHGNKSVTVHPRIAHSVFEEGSWVEDEKTHDIWAGLLASSCKENLHDDSNIIFITTLKQMTSLQVHLVQYLVGISYKYISPGGYPFAEVIICATEELAEVCGTDDLLRIDREIDHLRSLELIEGGIDINSDKSARIRPTPLALHLYVRGEGFPGSPTEYWTLKGKDSK